MTRPARAPLATRALHAVTVIVSAGAFTLVFFMVLPFIQAISARNDADTLLRAADSARLPPPPAAQPEKEEEEEEKEEEKPPELEQEAPPMSLADLQIALQGDFGGEIGAGLDLAKLGTGMGISAAAEDLVDWAELDQEPRVVYQVHPVLDGKLRKRGRGTVQVIFLVDENGKVQNPIVQRSTDPLFEKPALTAIKQWKFEPGKRKGKPVRFRMRVPMTFNQE